MCARMLLMGVLVNLGLWLNFPSGYHNQVVEAESRPTKAANKNAPTK